MEALSRRFGKLCTVLATVFLLVSSQLAFAQGNSNGQGNGNANGNGKSKNIGVGNASDGIKASVVTNKRIFYTGDPLSISVRFARGAELISSGEVEASVIIFSPSSAVTDETDTEDSTDTTTTATALSDAIVVPLSVDASTESVKLFELEEVDVSTLPAGTYQLGLILTTPGGDPLVINDWYRGLLGLVDIVGLTITDKAEDFDQDGDGQVDDDADGDGFSDETEEEVEEDTTTTT